KGFYYLNSNFTFYRLLNGYVEGDTFIQEQPYLSISKKLHASFKTLASKYHETKMKYVPLTTLLKQYDSEKKTQDFIVVEKNNLYGIMDYDGALIFEPQFTNVSTYSIGGFYTIQKEDKFGLINEQ